mgnify:CR=1 FL=1
MLLKVNLIKYKDKEMSRSIEEIEAKEKELPVENKQALKVHKKNAFATVKKPIIDYKLKKRLYLRNV